MASFKFLTSLTSIASSKCILCCWRAIWILFSSIAFSSSSGANSKNIPKSCKYKLAISSKVATLNLPNVLINDFLVGEYSITSDILIDIHSAVNKVKYKLDCNKCLVAVLEFAAAIFCIPTNASLSGILPSLASLSPVTSRIICK